MALSLMSLVMQCWQLAGRSSLVNLSELVALKQSASQQQMWLCDFFARALHAYQLQQWTDAYNGFSEILNVIPDGDPARFF